MYWENDAKQLLNLFEEDLRRACVARGTDPEPVVQRFMARVQEQVNRSGAEVVSGDLVRGILAAAGTPEDVASAGAPPPLPPGGAYAAPVAAGYPAMTPRQQGGSNAAMTCLVVGVVCVGLLIMLSVLAAIMLPALARAREAARRAACQNNLKQVSVSFAIYADNHQNQLPPLSNDLEDLMFDNAFMSEIDPALMQCPSDPDDWETSGADYIYLGYAVSTQEEVDALIAAYLANGGDANALAAQGPLMGPQGEILRLSWGLPGAEKIPVLIEWDGAHLPDGANVLYLDGHVEFLRMGAKFPMTPEFFDSIGRVWQ